MRDPWESLRVNARRQILAAARRYQTAALPAARKSTSMTCPPIAERPQLLASVAVGTGTDGGVVAPKPVKGHEANFAPDGLTYYVGDSYGKTTTPSI